MSEEVAYRGKYTRTFMGGGTGALIGAILGGPLGAVIGGAIGGGLGVAADTAIEQQRAKALEEKRKELEAK